jgi:hypothetical protein
VAKEGNFLVRTLSVLSESLHTETGKLNLIAAAVETVGERVHSKFGSVYRRVEDIEQVTATLQGEQPQEEFFKRDLASHAD